MADIARRVGVSRAAVSFVLNDRPDARISDETRERILQAASELGYRPNAGARALAARRSGLLGMVTEIVTSSFGPGAVRGAQDRAWGAGMFLMIAASEGRQELEVAAVERLLEQRVEGLIFASGPHEAVTVPPAAAEVPTVLLHCFDPDGALPAVIPDEQGGGYAATRRLLSAGHRRIGLVNVEAHSVAARGRLAGYTRALAEQGIAPDPELITHSPADSIGGWSAAVRLLDLPRPPTALFCCTDRMAMGAYDAIKERGLRIPDDVAVVGFDDQVIISAYLRPPLTTVALPFEEMGARAVEVLLARLAGQDVPDVTVVDCPLVERASV
ncbi:LacI family DNA-binding transcriptional regulator [Microlunatus ginsengisoli]